jgi:hypothetical protein
MSGRTSDITRADALSLQVICADAAGPTPAKRGDLPIGLQRYALNRNQSLFL